MKKVAVINDLSGIGRCSLNVAISILANLECQPCPLPTAILSNQTGFGEFTFLDFTEHMTEYFSHWEKIGYQFDTIYSGFLGSIEQMVILEAFIKQFKTQHTQVVIDPVMGDDGELYSIYPQDYPRYMKQFIQYADIITPNMTEFSLLTGYDFDQEGINKDRLFEVARALADNGPQQIAITGVRDKENPEKLWSIGLDVLHDHYIAIEVPFNGKSYSGTGDIFASVLTGYLTQGYLLEEAMQIATSFIGKAIDYTEQFNVDTKEGIYYEKFLKELIVNETI